MTYDDLEAIAEAIVDAIKPLHDRIAVLERGAGIPHTDAPTKSLEAAVLERLRAELDLR